MLSAVPRLKPNFLSYIAFAYFVCFALNLLVGAIFYAQ